MLISLGELVDWYSEENRDFALELLEESGIPWVMTPGNHDFELCECQSNGDESCLVHIPAREGFKTAGKGWAEKGVEFGNRVIDAGKNKIILLNSAFSDVEPGTGEWLMRNLDEGY